MPAVTFRVVDGIDKGRIFRDLPTPVTIGREEGNLLRLNDERVSRYHAKVQSDNGEIILTDLESTNGTRVNNIVVQIRRLRPGDRISIGRSQLVFGSDEEIRGRMAALSVLDVPPPGPSEPGTLPATVHASALAAQFDHDVDFDIAGTDKITQADGTLFLGNRPLPPLPQKMTPAQAAPPGGAPRFPAPATHHCHRRTAPNDEGTEITLGFSDWQRVLAVHMFLARYVRAIAEPDVLEE